MIQTPTFRSCTIYPPIAGKYSKIEKAELTEVASFPSYLEALAYLEASDLQITHTDIDIVYQQHTIIQDWNINVMPTMHIVEKILTEELKYASCRSISRTCQSYAL